MATIREQAERLARDNREADEHVSTCLWFPHDKEIRLVVMLGTAPQAGKDVLPFYFAASPEDELAASAIAIIRPWEHGQLRLPQGWGQWSDAIEV